MERNIIAPDVTKTTTTPGFRIGTTTRVGDTTYMYVRANSAITQYYFTLITGITDATTPCGIDGLTTGSIGSAPIEIGCAQVAFASSEYGWVAIMGKFTGFVGASCVQNVKLYTTATIGLVDDAATTLIEGLFLETTVGGANQNAICCAISPMRANC